MSLFGNEKKAVISKLAENSTQLTDFATYNTLKSLQYFSPVLWQKEAFPQYTTDSFDWNSTAFKTKVDQYYNLNFNMVTIQPFALIGDSGINERYTNLVQGIRYVKSKGLKVSVRPHYYNSNTDQTNTATLDQNLKTYLNNVAVICQSEGVALFVIGCEIGGRNFNLYDATYMTDVINGIRSRYSGLITYGASMHEAPLITWWNQCDFIGVDLYVRTTFDLNADVDQLYRGYYHTKSIDEDYDRLNYKTPYEYLKNLVSQHKKPIYLVEWAIMYGTNSNIVINIKNNANYTGYDMEQMQANGMEAMMRFQNSCGFIVGSNIWCDLVNDVGSWDDGKFLGRVKCENVVKEWGDFIGK